MAGIVASEECKIFRIISPQDIAGGALTGDYFDMSGHAHATIIVTCGAVTNSATLTVSENTTNVGGSADLIDFKYAQELTDAGDVLGALAWVGATTGIATGTENNTIHVIEIDAAQLSDGHNWVTLLTSNAGANFISAIAILSGSRYAGSENASVQG